jgi:CheY-like chemotaxis protein/signal transduction histidine kinase
LGKLLLVSGNIKKMPLMKFLNKLIRLSSFGLQGKFEDRVLNNIRFVNISSFTGFIFLLVFGIIAFIRGDLLHGLMACITSILLIGSIQYIRLTQNYMNAARFNLTVIIVFIFTALALGMTDDSAIIWFPLIPVLAVFLLGATRGSIVSLAFLLVTVIFFILPEEFTITHDISGIFILRLLGLYLALYIVSLIVEYFRVNQLQLIEMQILESKNETKLRESFISKLSHQIRTPLSNIMLVGQMVDKVNLTVEQKDMIETIIASANNLVNTIENIAEITDVNIEGKKKLQNTDFNLLTTLNSTIKLFTVQKEPVVEFALMVQDQLKKHELQGDPVSLKQIFLNLIETILKNKQPGKIKISINADIHNQDKEVTDIRFEITTSKPVNFNNGVKQIIQSGKEYVTRDHNTFINDIDLVIAQKIILQMGGKLHLLQTQEKNNVFLFTLPFKQSSLPAFESTEIPVEKESAEAALDYQEKLRNANVLLVEDNTINQKIVVLSLKNHIRHIDVASNGKEALDKFGTSKYDLILMDVQMPVIDGFVATRKIREIEATTNSHTPIIAITANALHGDREKCISAGMDDYISKPFQVEVLVEKIKYLLYKKT